MQSGMDELLKKIEEVAADVKGVTVDMRSLRQQLEDFGDDLDGVKRRLAEPERSSTPHVEIPLADKGMPTPRLANHGAPILGTAPATAGFHTAPSSPKDGPQMPAGDSIGEFVVRPCRHDFPRFSGDTPLLWIDLCLTYFEMYRVPEHHWVSTATLHLEGHAALWFQAFKHRNSMIPWDSFMQAVVEEFGQDEYDGQMTKLL